MKKLNNFLNILIGTFIGVFIGVFIGHGIYVYYDFKTHPDLYAMNSAPWYTSILVYGIFTLVVILVVIIAKILIKRYVTKH